MAELIELLSILTAFVIGALFILSYPSSVVVLLVFLFGILSGATGSRLAASVRRRQSIREMQDWARQMRSLYQED